jgi:hypothetical protein
MRPKIIAAQEFSYRIMQISILSTQEPGIQTPVSENTPILYTTA